VVEATVHYAQIARDRDNDWTTVDSLLQTNLGISLFDAAAALTEQHRDRVLVQQHEDEATSVQRAKAAEMQVQLLRRGHKAPGVTIDLVAKPASALRIDHL
jgi:hypothetical protein